MPAVEHVSDTARWVAIYRAMETDRPDALFQDRFARELAGDKGQAIVEDLPGAGTTSWPIIVRTAVFDEMILRAVREEGVDLVLNLAAGLDTRPYRLDLPPELRWVEVDLPGIIEHKESILRAETPRCSLERVVCDLSDVDARRATFASVTIGAKRVFVLTEGLVMYLTEEQVASLASDLAAAVHVRFWAMDLMGPWLRLWLNLAWRMSLGVSNVSFHFSPHDGPAFFKPFGWGIREHRSTEAESVRFDRLPLIARPLKYTQRLTPRRFQERSRNWSGYLLLEREPRSTLVTEPSC